MVSWIIGGAIFIWAGLIVFKKVKQFSKGQSGCCGGCDNCSCSKITRA